ncbi:MAG: fasciclin domain-containing protein [Flavobacteriales bacterium]
MNFISKVFLFIFISSAIISCKSEGKRIVENADNDPTEMVVVSSSEKKEQPKEQPKEQTKEQPKDIKNQMNSVMLKSMVTPDLKTFSSMLVTVGLADMLAKNEGPFTLIGPSNDAFASLGELKTQALLNTSNQNELVLLIKSHLIEGALDTEMLTQKIKDGNGSYEITTMSGVIYMATLEGTTVVLTDAKGASAQVEKSDVKGFNGVVHVLDAVLGVN